MSDKSSVKRIVRASHDKENPYFMMLRATAQNKNLSYEARGLIAYLLSKPDDWEIMIEDLCQECGRGRVYRIIKDLLEDNYLERIYHRDEFGKIVYVEYVVHEQPFIENPQMAKPKVGKPKKANRTLHNTDEEKKKEDTNLAATPDIVTKNVPPYLIPVFTAVANHIFKLSDFASFTVEEVRRYRAIAQIARTKAGGKDTPADEIARLVACYAKYCNDNGYTAPQAQLKFTSGFGAYMETHKPRAAAPVRDLPPPAAPDMTPTHIPAYDDPNWSVRHD